MWGDRPLSINEGAEGAVPTTAGRGGPTLINEPRRHRKYDIGSPASCLQNEGDRRKTDLHRVDGSDWFGSGGFGFIGTRAPACSSRRVPRCIARVADGTRAAFIRGGHRF